MPDEARMKVRLHDLAAMTPEDRERVLSLLAEATLRCAMDLEPIKTQLAEGKRAFHAETVRELVARVEFLEAEIERLEDEFCHRAIDAAIIGPTVPWD